MAIIFALLNIEIESNKLFCNDKIKDWMFYFFNHTIIPIIKRDYNNLYKLNISFITFNYDRLLEHFLYDSLTNFFFSADRNKLTEAIKKIKIFHVYGSLAPLTWQNSNESFEYGSNSLKNHVSSLCTNIKTIYEERRQFNHELILNEIKEAKKIYFLGFSFAKENLEILQIPNIFNHTQKILGTALNFQQNEIDYIKGLLTKQDFNHRPPTMFLENCDCLTLLKKYPPLYI